MRMNVAPSNRGSWLNVALSNRASRLNLVLVNRATLLNVARTKPTFPSNFARPIPEEGLFRGALDAVKAYSATGRRSFPPESVYEKVCYGRRGGMTSTGETGGVARCLHAAVTPLT